jgi:hypothetical protein
MELASRYDVPDSNTNPINPSDNPLVGIIRDTLYIDGGELFWQPLMKSGPPSTPIKDSK